MAARDPRTAARPEAPASRRWPGRRLAARRSGQRARVLVIRVSDGRGGAVRVPGLGAWLRRVAPARACGEVGIALVSDRTMRRLNRQFRGVDAATDVLSFPAGDRPDVPDRTRATTGDGGGCPPLGDLVIARGVAARQARQAGHPLATELRVLALHGLLHLCGYDHEEDGGRMARLERRLRRKGGLREGLIERGTPR